MKKKSYEMNRNEISMDKEISDIRKLFSQVADFRAKNSSHKLVDILMCGFAMFALKCKSVLGFTEITEVERINLYNVFGIEKVCSDTTLREVLDAINPQFLRIFFAEKFKTLKRTGLLQDYCFGIGSPKYLLVTCDGVQHFSSKSCGCPHCLTKEHRDGSTTFHHNLLCAVLVHPEQREVFVLDAEPILRQDGNMKNDCERNAAKRLQSNFKKSYEIHQKQYNFLFIEDALYANAPHITILKSNGYSFILNVKPDSHKTLFAYFEGKKQRKQTKYFTFTENGIRHEYEYLNNVLLCNGDPDLRVNFLLYTQTDAKGNKTVFTWITDIVLTDKNVMPVMKAGRSRWKIENETFNTLKNLGYHFEHNYGHGKDHLSTMFAFLMLAAFFIDQLVQACCHVFKQIEKNIKTKIKLWETMNAIFKTTNSISMEFIYLKIAQLFLIKITTNSA